MNKLTRRLGTLLLASTGLMLLGCGNAAQGHDGGGDKLGQLALPLVTQGASGVTYRLRDATFAVHHYNYGPGMGGGYLIQPADDGSGTTPPPGDEVTTVSSEEDPAAQNISLSLEEGEYYVELLPGWHFEKQTPQGSAAVTATLLSGQTQWVYVSRQSTSFAEFEFGLGDRSLWLNGQLNIGVVLHEDPNELPQYGGSGGTGYTGGSGGSVYYGGAGGAAGAADPGSGGTGSIPQP